MTSTFSISSTVDPARIVGPIAMKVARIVRSALSQAVLTPIRRFDCAAAALHCPAFRP